MSTEPLVVNSGYDFIAAEFSPGGSLVLSHGRQLRVWTSDGEESQYRAPEAVEVLSAEFLNDYEIVVVRDRLVDKVTSREVVIVNVTEPSRNERVLFAFEGTKRPSVDVRVGANGRVVALALRRFDPFGVEGWIPPIVKVVDTRGLDIVELVHKDGHLLDYDVSSDGELLVTGGDDGNARVRRLDGAGPPIVLPHGERVGVNDVEFGRDSEVVATAAEDGVARVWRLNEVRAEAGFTHDGPVRAVLTSADGMWVATDSDGTTKVWSLAGDGEARSLDGRLGRFSPDGARLVTLSGAWAKVWRASDWELVDELPHAAAVRGASFHPDGSRLVTTSADGAIQIWRLGWGAMLAYLKSATSVCLEISQRIALLGETQAEATRAVQDCEQTRSRVFALPSPQTPVSGVGRSKDNVR